MDKPIPHINILKKYLYTYICTHLIVCVHSVMFKACNSGAVNNDPWRTWPVENLPKYHCLECHRSINYALHEPSRSNVQGTHKTWEQWAVETKSEQWTVFKTRNGSHHSSPISSENVSLMFFPNDGSYTTLGKVVKFWKLRNFPACPPWMKTWVGQRNLPPTSKHISESGIKSAKLFLGYLVSNMSSPWHQGMLVDHWMPNAKKLSQICNSSWSENAPSTFMWPALGLHVNCTQCTHAWSH